MTNQEALKMLLECGTNIDDRYEETVLRIVQKVFKEHQSWEDKSLEIFYNVEFLKALLNKNGVSPSVSDYVEALNDLKKRNEALKNEGHFHIGSITMEMIEKSIVRNIPIKVDKSIGSKDENKVWSYRCPSCAEIDECEILEHYNYCPICGKALSWI